MDSKVYFLMACEYIAKHLGFPNKNMRRLDSNSIHFWRVDSLLECCFFYCCHIIMAHTYEVKYVLIYGYTMY